MVKIRLEGTSAEVASALEEIEKQFNVLSVSREYANRSASQYVRVYVDVQDVKSPAPLLERLQAMLEECKEKEREIDARRDKLTCGELYGDKGRALLEERDEIVLAIAALYSSIYCLEKTAATA